MPQQLATNRGWCVSENRHVYMFTACHFAGCLALDKTLNEGIHESHHLHYALYNYTVNVPQTEEWSLNMNLLLPEKYEMKYPRLSGTLQIFNCISL